jgi:hypothetical protein
MRVAMPGLVQPYSDPRFESVRRRANVAPEMLEGLIDRAKAEVPRCLKADVECKMTHVERLFSLRVPEFDGRACEHLPFFIQEVVATETRMKMPSRSDRRHLSIRLNPELRRAGPDGLIDVIGRQMAVMLLDHAGVSMAKLARYHH